MKDKSSAHKSKAHSLESGEASSWPSRFSLDSEEAVMVGKRAFPKYLILLIGILTFTSNGVYGAGLSMPQAFKTTGAYGGHVIIATGAKKKKWAIPKKQGASGSASDGWKSMGMKDKLETAQNNYQLNCSKCHGINGDGKGDLADELEVPPRDHTNAEYMSERSDEQLFRTISEGGAATGFDEAMPPHISVITEKEIRGLVEYLRKLCDCKYKRG